jgi:hypothetical protein
MDIEQISEKKIEDLKSKKIEINYETLVQELINSGITKLVTQRGVQGHFWRSPKDEREGNLPLGWVLRGVKQARRYPIDSRNTKCSICDLLQGENSQNFQKSHWNFVQS